MVSAIWTFVGLCAAPPEITGPADFRNGFVLRYGPRGTPADGSDDKSRDRGGPGDLRARTAVARVLEPAIAWKAQIIELDLVETLERS